MSERPYLKLWARNPAGTLPKNQQIEKLPLCLITDIMLSKRVDLSKHEILSQTEISSLLQANSSARLLEKLHS
jgi:hypothetical protein